MPPSLKRLCEAYQARLRDAFDERLRGVTLFGSFASGSAHEDSDVDVLVLIDKLDDDVVTLVVRAAVDRLAAK